MRRYRKAGLTVLAVFAVQLIAAGFCAIPSVHAAPATRGTAIPRVTNMQCTMAPMTAGQDMPEYTHCNTPDLNTFFNQINDVPATWALVAVLPTLLHQADLASEQGQPPFIAHGDPPRSTSLLYRTSLRIRL